MGILLLDAFLLLENSPHQPPGSIESSSHVDCRTEGLEHQLHSFVRVPPSKTHALNHNTDHHGPENKRTCPPADHLVFLAQAREATSNKGHRYERSKDATNGAPGHTTRSNVRY